MFTAIAVEILSGNCGKNSSRPVYKKPLENQFFPLYITYFKLIVSPD
jgi:hypothetical protein